MPSSSATVRSPSAARLRLANALAQLYAQYLVDHLDELFVSDKEAGHGDSK